LAVLAACLSALAIPFLGSVALGTPGTTQPAGGTIHIYIVNASTNSSTPNAVLITGAFSDHGTGHKGVFHLTKGTITANNSKIAAIVSNPNFGSFNSASCSFWGTATGPVQIVSGTGAYAGITGTLSTTFTEAGQGSLLPDGKCNQSNNAPLVASVTIVTATGRVTFHRAAPRPTKPTKLTLKLGDATSIVDATSVLNLVTDTQTDRGTFASGNYSNTPNQVPPGTKFTVTLSVNAPLPPGSFIEAIWTGSPHVICKTTNVICAGSVTYPSGAINVGITGDIGNATGTEGVSITVAADPHCTDGKNASQHGGRCPGSR
jgi:hypothetical protein